MLRLDTTTTRLPTAWLPTRPAPPDWPVPAGMVETVRAWMELGRRPGPLALLVALDSGPTTPRQAMDKAARWSQGRLLDTDLPAHLETLVADGLAVRLGGGRHPTLVVITSAGQAVLDEFAQAIAHHEVLVRLCERFEATAFRARLRTLTASDRRVLLLLQQGHTNAQIARRLGISLRAAESRVSRLVRRTGMPSRNALIARLAIEEHDPNDNPADEPYVDPP